MFTDVDAERTTTVEAFEPDGSSLGPVAGPAVNNGLSFVGLEAPAGERIVRVRITSGNTTIAAGNVDGQLGGDVVATDDFI